MSQGIFEAAAKAKLLVLSFEDKTWSNGLQHLNKVKLSRVKGNSIGRRPCASSAASCGSEKCFKALWLNCLLQIPWQKFILRQVKHSLLKGTVELLRYVWGAFRKEHFKPAHFWGRQQLISSTVFFLVGPAPNQMETAYDCAKNTQPLSLLRAQHATCRWVGRNGSSSCMVLHLLLRFLHLLLRLLHLLLRLLHLLLRLSHLRLISCLPGSLQVFHCHVHKDKRPVHLRWSTASFSWRRANKASACQCSLQRHFGGRLNNEDIPENEDIRGWRLIKTSQMDYMFFSSSPVWAACRKKNLSLMTSVFLRASRSALLLFLRFLFKETKLDARWQVGNKHVTCGMSQGKFEAKQKQTCLKEEV